MRRLFAIFAFLLMSFASINCAKAEDFLAVINNYAKNVANSTLKSLNLQIAEKAAGSSYKISFYVDKYGNFSNFQVVTSTNNPEVDAHIISVIKSQAHKVALPAQMSKISKPIKLTVGGNFQHLNKEGWEEYVNQAKNEVFKNTDTITTWIKESPNKLNDAAYTVYVDKNGIFYKVYASQSSGDLDFDTKMINLIKSKSGIIPLPEKYKMSVQSFTITLDISY